MSDDPPLNPISALRRPGSCGELFWVFTRLALQGFGGVLAVTQRELVERERWLSSDEFVDMLSWAQMLPGPNIINLALMLGDRFLGWRGACSAVAGMLAAPLVIVLALASLHRHWASGPMVSGALRGMGVVTAGLIAATALKLMPTLRRNRLGWPLCSVITISTLLAIGVWRLPLWLALGSIGAGSLGLAWHAWRPSHA